MADEKREQPAALLSAGVAASSAGTGDQAANAGTEAAADDAWRSGVNTSVEVLSAELAELRKDLERNRLEDSTRADVLQGLEEERRKSRRQRLLDSGAAIALVALAFSLFTYWLDDRRAGEEAQQNARRELSELVSQLNDLPVDQAALMASIGEENATALSGTMNGRQQIIASQAEQLLDTYPEMARSLDYLVLGQARARNAEHAAALDQLRSADLLPHTLVVDVAIKHGLATSSFGLGSFEAGRSYFAQALSVGDRYSAATPQVREWQAIISRGAWSLAEVNAGNCVEAAEQINLLNEAAVETSTPGLYGRPISLQIERLIQGVELLCPATPMQTDTLARLATNNLIPDAADTAVDE